MVDVVDAAVRSRMMSNIKGKNTKPELLVRKLLHAAGYRFRLHVAELPGKPDIVLRKHKAAIFVNGCFWHGHGCHLFRLPSTRTEFWETKIAANSERDKKAIQSLFSNGWRVATVWECALKGKHRLPHEIVGIKLVDWLNSGSSQLEVSGMCCDYVN